MLNCLRLFSLDAIINENYKYLKGFLEDLSPPERSALIQDWELAGLVYLDYIRVIEMVDRIQQVTDCDEWFFFSLWGFLQLRQNRIVRITLHSSMLTLDYVLQL